MIHMGNLYMKTKIASLISILLMIVCSVQLYLLLRNTNEVRREEKSRGAEERPSIRPAENVRQTPTVKAIGAVMPSVVNISSRRVLPQDVFPDPSSFERQEFRNVSESDVSIGSGIIIDESGLVVTTAHVVYRAIQIQVSFGGGPMRGARVIAEDLANDIALLKIDGAENRFAPIRTIYPGDMILGEMVIAVGNPYGLDGSITVGVLSGINRSLVSGGKVLFSDLIQTDAAVFPGNSGGPLINLEGRMLGMNMAVRRNAPGIGFAIPLLRIENVLAGFMLPERFAGLSLGILPQMRPDGSVYVAKVFPNSPAERAGIKPGAVITGFQEWNPAGSLLDFSRKLIRLRAGEPVELSFEGESRIRRLTPMPIDLGDGVMLADLKLRLGIQKLTPRLAGVLDYPFDDGVIINSVSPDALIFGIRRGDVLVKLSNRVIHSPEDIAKVLRDVPPSTRLPAVTLSVASNDQGEKFLVRRNLVLQAK